MAKTEIKIKSNKGNTFTTAARKRGMEVREFANQILMNKEAYSPAMVKKANFLKNPSRNNKYDEGGKVENTSTDHMRRFIDATEKTRAERSATQTTYRNSLSAARGNTFVKFQDGTTKIYTHDEWGDILKSKEQGSTERNVFNTGTLLSQEPEHLRSPISTSPQNKKFRQHTVRKRTEAIRDEVPEYAIGGAISGATAGLTLGGPAGAIVGGILGGAAELIGNNRRKKEERRLADAQASARRMQQARDTKLGELEPQIEYAPVFMKGGKIMKYAEGGQANVSAQEPQPIPGAHVELEGGESFQTPQGTEGVVEGPSHAQGGVQMELPEGTEIYSDRLKVPGTNNTFSDENKKILSSKSKYEKILSNPRSTRLAKNTARRMLEKLQNDQDSLFNAQQRINHNNTGSFSKQFFGGGIVDSFKKLQGNEKLAGGINSALTLAPTLYNIGKGLFGKAETYNASDFYNPMETTALTRMRNRSIDSSPMIEQNRQAANIARYNLRNTARTRGELMGGYAPIAMGESRANAEIKMQQQQLQNQYSAETARMEAEFGTQRAATNFQVADINARSRAAQRNFTATGLSQLSQFTQMREKTKGLERADKMRINAIKNMFPDVWEKLLQIVPEEEG